MNYTSFDLEDVNEQLQELYFLRDVSFKRAQREHMRGKFNFNTYLSGSSCGTVGCLYGWLYYSILEAERPEWVQEMNGYLSECSRIRCAAHVKSGMADTVIEAETVDASSRLNTLMALTITGLREEYDNNRRGLQDIWESCDIRMGWMRAYFMDAYEDPLDVLFGGYELLALMFGENQNTDEHRRRVAKELAGRKIFLINEVIPKVEKYRDVLLKAQEQKEDEVELQIKAA